MLPALTSRRAVLLLALLVVVVGALLVTAPARGYWVVDPDAAAYVGLARSLAAGDGYVLQGIPHAKFPPGFPAVLALAIRATGDPQCYATMRDLVTFFGLLDIVLAYAVARRVLRLLPGGALLVAFACATSIYQVQYTVAYLRSESLFTACFLATLLAGQAWRERSGWRGAVLSGLCAAAAISVRSAGLAAIAGVALARLLRPADDAPRDATHDALRGAPRPAHRLALDLRAATLAQVALFGLLGVLPMLLQKQYVASRSAAPGVQSSSYGDELFAAAALDLTKNVDVARPTIGPFSSAMAERVAGNVAALALSLGKFVANAHKGANLAVGSRSGALHAGGLALLALLALGLAAAARARLVLAVATSVAYLGLYAIWPFNQQQRFYQPLAPLLLVLLAWGARPVLDAALRVAGSAAGRWLLALLALGLAAALATVHSDDPAVLGRWSRSYAALLGVVGAAGVALAALAFLFRARPLSLEGRRVPLQRAALAGIALLWAASFVGALRELRADQAEFLADRALHPVPARFERIKTNPELLTLLARLMELAGPGDLVMSDIPKMIHELTGLRTTPLRFDTARRELVLDTPEGRPTFLYHSPELPDVSAMIDAWRLAHPGLLHAEHTIDLHEGTLSIPLALYRVAPAQ